MVDYKYKDLYDEDSVKKEIKIAWDTGEIGNTDLHSENITLTESLYSDDELRFGACEASELKFRISNVFEPLKGKKLSFSSFFTGYVDVPFQFGEFTVASDTKSADRKYRDITAYDKMYDINNAEVSAWYNGLTFPLTLKAFRDSFCAYVGVEQEDVTLVNDSMIVEETIKPSELSGQTVIESICEINGCFGHIGRNGKLQYVKLEPFQKGLYPSTTLFPAKDLYPQKASVLERLSKSKYISCQYEDFICQSINKLQIRQSENDIGAVSGTGDNCYVVEDNFLVYGKTAEDLQVVADNLYSVINKVWYRPAQIEAKGNPCYEVGDGIIVNTSQDVIYTYILVRTLSGIQALRDSYLSEGKEYRSKQVNGTMKSIVQLRGKVNELTRNVEETKSEIKDVESGLDTKITQNAEKIESEATRATSAEETLNSKITQTAEQISSEVTRAQGAESTLSSQISQTAEQISLKVSKGDVSAQLSIESGQVSISGDRFVLSATNCSISKEGKITAKDVDLSGKITASSGNIAGFTIESKKMYNNSSSLGTGSSGVYIGTDGISLGNRVVLKSDGSATLKDATLEGDLKISGSLGTISFSSGGNSMSLDRNGISFAASSISTKITSSEVTVGSSLNYSKATSSGIQIRGSGGFLNIYASTTTWASSSGTYYLKDNSNNNLAYISVNHFSAVASNVLIGKSGGNVAFFGATSGSTKKTVSKLSSPSSATASTIASKLNDLIGALQAYNLIG